MYYVKWKRQGEWKDVFSSLNPSEAVDYAMNKIVHGRITERIEIHDTGGCIRVEYDSSWK